MIASPSWPTGLPQIPLASGLSAEMRDTRESFEPQRGPSISRMGFTADLKQFSMGFSLDLAQLATFEAFVRDDLARGSLKFGMRDPETLDIHLFKIVPGQGLYRQRRVGPGRVTVSMDVLRTGVPWYAAYSPAGIVLPPTFLADFEGGRYAINRARRAQGSVLDVVTGGISVSGGALISDGETELEVILDEAPGAKGTVLVSAYSSDGSLTIDASDGTNTLEIGAVTEGTRFSAAVAWDADAGLMWGALNGAAGIEAEESFDGSGAPTDLLPPVIGGIYRVAFWAEALTKAQIYALTT